MLWENIIAIANEPAYENVCKYFQGVSLEMDLLHMVHQLMADSPVTHYRLSRGPPGTKELALKASYFQMYSAVLIGME